MKKLLFILAILLTSTTWSKGQIFNTGQTKPTVITPLQGNDPISFYLDKSDTVLWAKLGRLGDYKLWSAKKIRHVLDSLANAIGTPLIYKNGLRLDGDSIKLGGGLTEDTEIQTNTKGLLVSGSNDNAYFGLSFENSLLSKSIGIDINGDEGIVIGGSDQTGGTNNIDIIISPSQIFMRRDSAEYSFNGNSEKRQYTSKISSIIRTSFNGTSEIQDTTKFITKFKEVGETYINNSIIKDKSGIRYSNIPESEFTDTTIVTKHYVDNLVGTVSDATTTTKGIIQLAGDLSGTSASPTVVGLSLKENLSNKENTTVDNSTTKYPTVNLLKTYADTKLPITNINGTIGYIPKFTGTNSIGNSPIYTDGTNVGIGATPNAFLEIAGGVSGRVQLTDGGGNSRKALIIEQPGYGWNAYSRIQTYDYGNDTFPLLSLQTAGGDVQIGSLSGTGTRLATASADGTLGVIADGSNGQVLKIVDNIPVFTDDLNADLSTGTLSGTNVTWDYSVKKNYNITLTGNTVITITNVSDGDVGTLYVTNAATPYTITLAGYVNSIDPFIRLGSNMVITSGGSKSDDYTFKYNGSKLNWNGTLDRH